MYYLTVWENGTEDNRLSNPHNQAMHHINIKRRPQVSRGKVLYLSLTSAKEILANANKDMTKQQSITGMK